MATIEQLQQNLQSYFNPDKGTLNLDRHELTLELEASELKTVCLTLRDNPVFQFDSLMDVAGIDYLDYGLSEWTTQEASHTSFDRGCDQHHKQRVIAWDKPRFASVYQLLSTKLNQRLRLRVFVPEHDMTIDSVTDIWPSANWFEREAFDLFGILYQGHPDLRRILTDYGFMGHPFRKDFPLSGHVEVRYDAEVERVVYETVDIEPRVLVPKVIRGNSRYTRDKNKQETGDE